MSELALEARRKVRAGLDLTTTERIALRAYNAQAQRASRHRDNGRGPGQ